MGVVVAVMRLTERTKKWFLSRRKKRRANKMIVCNQRLTEYFDDELKASDIEYTDSVGERVELSYDLTKFTPLAEGLAK